MKNKSKKILFILIVFCVFFMYSNNVKAETYNGTGGVTLSAGYGSCGTLENCLYNNGNIIVVRVSLWYYDGANWSRPGNNRVFYYADTKGYNFLKDTWKNVFEFKALNSCPENTKEGKYQCASRKIREYYGETNNVIDITNNSKKDVNWMLGYSAEANDNYKNVLTQSSQPTNKVTPATYGYRIFIEPAVNVANVNENGNKSKAGLYTVKDLAKFTQTSNPSQMTGNASLAQQLYTQWKDVGIEAGVNNPPDDTSNTYCSNITYEQFKDSKNGCGYNILDLSNFSKPRCYKSVIPNSDAKLKCVNTDKNNIISYKEEFEEADCPENGNGTSEVETNTKHGKLMGESSNCKIYCKESATASFPGNISGDIGLGINPRQGSYFAWPTRYGIGMYNMSMSSGYTCRIVRNDSGTSCSSEEIESLKSKVETSLNNNKFEATLTAGTNNKINEPLVIDRTKTTKNDNVSFGSDGISNEISYNKKVYFKIASTTNRYYNRTTDRVVNSGSSREIFDRGEGVISLKKTDNVMDKDGKPLNYELKLSNINLGSNNKFGSLIDNYVCHYRLASNSTDCICPEGTLNEGESLICTNDGSKDEYCADLIEKWCDEDKSNWPDTCDDDEKNDICIDNNGNKVNLSTCITEQQTKGYTRNEAKGICEQEFCTGCIDKNGKNHDLRECLIDNSYESCYKQYCPDTNKGVCVGECRWVEDKTSSGSTISTHECYNEETKKWEACGTKFYCPGGNTPDMDPTACVQSKAGYLNLTNALNRGWITKNELIQYLIECEQVVCPYGNKIVYRVIDLDNPFPGKNNSGPLANFTNKGRGRKPGYNWKSETVVKNKILKARGATGYDLYKKEPLYVITLTPNKIKEIREYNKNNKYTDFNLTCKNKNTSKCISDFVHKEFKDILTGGKCQNMSNSADFDSCYNGS